MAAWKPEPAGNMHKRITIEAPVGNRDPRGGIVPAYGVVGVFWAKARPITPSEFLKTLGGQAMQGWAEHATEFTMQYVPGGVINHTCRIKMDGRLFNIVGVANRDERNINLVITAYEAL